MGHNMYVPVPRKGRFIIIGFGGNLLNNAERIQKMEKCIYSFFLILLFCNNIVSSTTFVLFANVNTVSDFKKSYNQSVSD